MFRPVFRPYFWFVGMISLIVPQRFRREWRQEWEAELHQRELRLAEWRRLDLNARLYLMRRSLGSFVMLCGCSHGDWETNVSGYSICNSNAPQKARLYDHGRFQHWLWALVQTAQSLV